MKRAARALAILIAVASGQSVLAGKPEERSDELIHSDVALWGFDHKDIWPQHFTVEKPEYTFGCTSRIAFGDWQVTKEEPDSGERWIRLSNYGVFHCALIERRDYNRKQLANATYEYGFAVKIGETTVSDRKLELWVLQSGMRTGSTYTLLAREPGDGMVKQFTVLQRKCPAGSIRKGPNLDIWSTSYCAINSQAEMVNLAKRMARLPPLATMKWIGGDEPEAREEED